MDLSEAGDAGSGCEDENCSSTLSSSVSRLDQFCTEQEPLFGFIELALTSVVYLLLMIFGLLGNMLTILVVWLRPYMRSSTYLYLSSMAVSDMLILLLQPLELYKLWWPTPWPFGVLPCKLTMFLSECCTFCTILHITFLSLERYLAVCWPMTAKILVTRRRTKTIIGCLWLGAAVSAAPVWVMVGVEDVRMESSGLSGWQEGEGEERFLIDGSGAETFQDGRVEEGNTWKERDVMEWTDGMKVFNNIKGKDEDKPSARGRTNWSVADKGDAGGERMVEGEGERQNRLKEDEGGGEGGGSIDYMDGEYRGNCDAGECRWTNYAKTSGLLWVMLIVSNMYFLVSVCILGLVYSLIGRTLWYRPLSSRRDCSHRHTVKMLGVIVLAFVLCWLPFHMGRTIFTLYSAAHEQAAFTDIDLHIDTNASSNGSNDTHPSIPTIDVACFKAPADTRKTNTENSNMLAYGDRDVQTHTYADRDTNPAYVSTGIRTTPIMYIKAQSSHHRVLPTASIIPDATMSSDHLNDMLNETHPDNAYTHFHYFLVQYFNLVSSVFFYLSAVINPLLYNLMSVRYKHAVHSLIRTHSHVQSNRRHTFTATGQSTTTV